MRSRAAGALMAAVASVSLSADEPLRLVTSIALPHVEGRIDHLAVDASGQRLFLAALGNNTVEVLDLATSTHARSLNGFHEPQGIAVATDEKLVAVANGEGEGIQLLSADTYAPTTQVRLGEDSDNVRYDAAAKRLYVGFGSGALVAIDPAAGKAVGEVRLAGHPESFQLERSGPRIFVNVPAADQIAVVDRGAMKVIATWPVAGARANFPMALDETNHRLFVGCRHPAKVLVFETSSGRQTGSFEVVGDTDDLFFDAARQRVYVSGGEGYLDVVDVRPGGSFERIARVTTAAGARTSLFVPALNRLFLAVPHRGSQSAEVRVYEAPPR